MRSFHRLPTSQHHKLIQLFYSIQTDRMLPFDLYRTGHGETEEVSLGHKSLWSFGLSPSLHPSYFTNYECGNFVHMPILPACGHPLTQQHLHHQFL